VVDEKWSARFRTRDQIRSHGAIGNLNDGVEIMTHGVPTRLICTSQQDITIELTAR
jgi:hypothetical protein